MAQGTQGWTERIWRVLDSIKTVLSSDGAIVQRVEEEVSLKGTQTSGEVSSAPVSDEEVRELLYLILTELRYMNQQLAIATDEELYHADS